MCLPISPCLPNNNCLFFLYIVRITKVTYISTKIIRFAFQKYQKISVSNPLGIEFRKSGFEVYTNPFINY